MEESINGCREREKTINLLLNYNMIVLDSNRNKIFLYTFKVEYNNRSISVFILTIICLARLTTTTTTKTGNHFSHVIIITLRFSFSPLVFTHYTSFNARNHKEIYKYTYIYFSHYSRLSFIFLLLVSYQPKYLVHLIIHVARSKRY